MKIAEVYGALRRWLTMLGRPRWVHWEAFEPYTTRVFTGRLAQAFDAALAKGNASTVDRGFCQKARRKLFFLTDEVFPQPVRLV